MFNSSSNLDPIDVELSRKAKKTCDKINESIYMTANEPTLACFRIQEHIQRTVPILFDRKSEMLRNESVLKGVLYDIEYSKDSIHSLQRSSDLFDSIHHLMKDSIYFKQQIEYDENVRCRVLEKLQQQKESNRKQKENVKEMSVPLNITNNSSSNWRSRFSNSTTNRRSNANRFNRFSTSFDFSNPLPIVASSVSADIKSLINQFTSKDSASALTSTNLTEQIRPNSTGPSQVSSSKSLYTLPEILTDKNEGSFGLKNDENDNN